MKQKINQQTDSIQVSSKAAFKQLLALLRPFRWMIAGAAILSAATILANVGLLAVSAVLISLAALQPPLLDLMVYIVGVRFFGISRAVLRYTERYVTHDITFRILSRLRVDIFKRMEPLAPAGLAHYSDGQLFQRLLGDIEVLKYFYLRAVVAPAAAIVVLVICSLFLGQFSIPAMLLLMASLLFFGIAVPWWMGHKSSQYTEKQQMDREQWQTMLSDYLHGLAELKSTEQIAAYQDKLWKQLEVLEQHEKYLGGIGLFTSNLLTYGSHLALWGSLLLTIPAVSAGALPGVYLAMVALIVWSSFEAIYPFPQALIQLQQSLAAARHVFALPASADTALSENRVTGKKETQHLANNDMIIENVCFSYDDKRRTLYEDFSLACPAGSHIALVGCSGSGKSTLLQLLLKFRYPKEGRITIGGISLDELPDEQVRQAMGVVEQDTYLFHATVRENLLLAKPDATDYQILEAMDFAELTDVVEDLPQGLETILGENGFRLSGGQRQRIALARLYLQDRPILLLDEAMQGLDNITAKHLTKKLTQWGKEKTIIQITHSLQYLEDVDCIYVLEDGRIVEAGTRQELLVRKGKFYQMDQLERQRL